MTDEEKELVRRSIRGDREAFAALYRLSWPAVLSAVIQHVTDWDHARSVAQNVFLRAWKGLPRLREPDRFGGWIQAIAGNEVREWQSLAENRESGRRLPLEAAAAVPDRRQADPSVVASRREFEAMVQEELEDFAPLARQVVFLRLLANLEYREIGERLGIGLHQARGLGIRGAAKLAKRLAERVGEEPSP